MLLTLILSVSLIPGIVASACLEAPEGKRIGLVLSGGGARGTAHVAVLQLLENLRIPIHCIAGTSLGAVVGGLYARGLGADEIEDLVNGVDWNRGFVDEFPRNLLPLRRKDEEDEFLIKFELGLRNRTLNLPRGVIQGHSLHLLLKELMAGASLTKDFNRLPIPFRAVATDIVNAESVPLESGDLALAIQASMAIPGVYAPIEIDGRLLVDGGVAQNLPVSVVREMGADVIIAVDIGTPLAPRESLQSVVAIIDQLTNVLTGNNVSAETDQLRKQDVYIQPDLGLFTSMDFASANEIMAVGKVEAERYRAALSRHSINEADYQRYKERLSVIPTLPDRIVNVELLQHSRLSTDLLAGRMKTDDDDEVFDSEVLHNSLNVLYSTGIYERVSYEYVGSGEAVGIRVEAEEKTWGPDLIRFGFSLEDDFSGNNNFGFSVGYTRKAINSFGGDVRAIGELGERPGVLLEYFQPLATLSPYYGLVRFEHQQYSQGAFTGSAQTGEFRTRRNEIGFYAGRQFANHSDIRGGVRFGTGQVRRRVGDVSLEERSNFDEASFYLGYRYDTLDSRSFPASGNRFRLAFERSLEELGADEDYDALSLDVLSAAKLDVIRLIGAASFQSATRNDLPAQKLFSLGGLLDPSGLDRDDQVGQHAASITTIAYRPFNSQQIKALDFPVYYGGSLALGGVFQARDDIEFEALQVSGSVFVAADTPVGPAFLGIGLSEGQGVLGLLSLGVTF